MQSWNSSSKLTGNPDVHQDTSPDDFYSHERKTEYSGVQLWNSQRETTCFYFTVTAVKGKPEEGNEEAVHTDKAQSQENTLAASAKNRIRNVRTATNMERMGMPGCGSTRIKQTERAVSMADVCGTKVSRCKIPGHSRLRILTTHTSGNKQQGLSPDNLPRWDRTKRPVTLSSWSVQKGTSETSTGI